MVKIGIIFVIAIVLLVVSFKMKTALQDESSQMDNYKQTFAIIDKVIFPIQVMQNTMLHL